MLSGLGYVYALSGRLSEALPLLEEATRGEASISAMGLGQAIRISRLAEGCFLAGRANEALKLARSAIDLSRGHKERANEAVGLRVLAEVMARSDPLDAKALRSNASAASRLPRDSACVRSSPIATSGSASSTAEQESGEMPRSI